MSFNIAFADLLDKLALEVEREPAKEEPKTAAAPARAPAPPAERSKAAKLAELIESSTGTAMPSDVAERIASDESLFEHVTKLAELGARPNSLGEAVVKEGSSAPTTRQEKLAAAWNNWGNNIRNNG